MSDLTLAGVTAQQRYDRPSGWWPSRVVPIAAGFKEREIARALELREGEVRMRLDRLREELVDGQYARSGHGGASERRLSSVLEAPTDHVTASQRKARRLGVRRGAASQHGSGELSQDHPPLVQHQKCLGGLEFL